MGSWTRLCAVAVLGIAMSACASSKETGFPDPSLVPTDEPHVSCSEITDEPQPVGDEVLVLDNCYAPKVAVVASGQEVLWVQDGVAPHTVTFVDLPVDSHPDCRENIGACMADGDEFTYTFVEPGEYLYYCVIHGTADGAGMAATLVVE